ncbi:hypothetical protein [Nannocystis punicea]|uniref:MAM domain-containing protein n=1 Tax=Nannocystis punicea TaxID=2995304 RepID=A0ABY7H4V2_9BACT|nr:hypothetical protein [Nannocystis poenicansa]WAS94289.1 hypothetical protein O0S08_49845 [Nannocystis poenicansa]
MRRSATGAAPGGVVLGWLALVACRPVLYDFYDSAGVPDPATDTVPTTMSSETDSTVTDAPPPSPTETCFDGVVSGTETDVDCGGPACPACEPWQKCAGPWDCVTNLCIDNLCGVPQQCRVAEDCPAEVCRQPLCEKEQCVYAELNGDKCDDGDPCTDGDLCLEGQCTGALRDCSGYGGVCQQGFCNPASGKCAVEFLDGEPCDDGLSCTLGDFCAQGQCLGKQGPVILFDFNDPGLWQFDPPWMIGPALPSACDANGFEDPPEDHSPDGENMLAGAAIGGCLPGDPLPADACLTSPELGLPPEVQPSILMYWSRLSAVKLPLQQPSSARVEVWSGKAWTVVFETLNEPFEEPEWAPHMIDITPLLNPELRVRFCHHHPEPGLPPAAGWSVDDVYIGPPECQPP